jgi:hypothetical protein
VAYDVGSFEGLGALSLLKGFVNPLVVLGAKVPRPCSLRSWQGAVRYGHPLVVSGAKVSQKVSLRSWQGALPLHPIGKLCRWFRYRSTRSNRQAGLFASQFSNPFHDFLFEFADRAPVRTTAPSRVVGGPSGSHPPRLRTASFELNLWDLRNVFVKTGTQLSCLHGAGVIPRFHSPTECLFAIRLGSRSVPSTRKFRKGLGKTGRVSQWGRAREGAKPHLECAVRHSMDGLRSLRSSAVSLRSWQGAVRCGYPLVVSGAKVSQKVSLRSWQGALPLHPIGKPAWFSNPFHDFLFESTDRVPIRTTAPSRVVGGPSGSHPPRLRTTSFELNLWNLRNILLGTSRRLSCLHGAGVIPRFHCKTNVYFRFVPARDPCPQSENSGGVWESEEAGFAGSNELSDSETKNTAPVGFPNGGELSEGAKPHLECAVRQPRHLHGTLETSLPENSP